MNGNIVIFFSMANLLGKFRIDYSSLTMVQDITEPPQPETKQLFEDTIKKFTEETMGQGKTINYLLYYF